MKKHLNIAFFGSSLVSAYWNGAATYYRGIIKNLYRRGHLVTFYEPDAFERQQHRDIEDPYWSKVKVYQPENGELFKCLEEASKANVIIKASGIGINDDLIAREVINLKNSHNKIIYWDVDAPATLDSVFRGENNSFKELIPKYDYILTYGGGQPVIDAYRSLNSQDCIPVYNALDPDTHYKVLPEPRFRCDLAFLGNRLPDREKRVEHFFLETAEKLSRKKFILGGSGWESKPLPPNVQYLGHIYTKDHNAFNCTPRAVLNISRDSMAEYGFSPATRIFEAAGAAACIISDDWKGMELFLEPGKEILIAKNAGQVASILNGLDEKSARKIGSAARNKILAHHTYEQRGVQIEKILLS
jgi:spore maturation protein CgeB